MEKRRKHPKFLTPSLSSEKMEKKTKIQSSLQKRKMTLSRLNVDTIKQLLQKKPTAFEEIPKRKPRRNKPKPFRYKNKKRHFKKQKHKFQKIKPKAIISIQITKNNIIMTLTDNRGNAKAWSSMGSCGFKGKQKKSAYATKTVAQNLAKKTAALKYKWIHIRINGTGKGKIKNAIKPFKRLKIVRIVQATSIPHNGCREPKKRRV